MPILGLSAFHAHSINEHFFQSSLSFLRRLAVNISFFKGGIGLIHLKADITSRSVFQKQHHLGEQLHLIELQWGNFLTTWER